MENLNDISKNIELYLNEKSQICNSFPIKNTSELVLKVINTYINDGTIFVMANGGASSAAEGFATDLRTHPFVSEDKNKTSDVRRLKVICFTESSGNLTGISNDLGFENIFSEQLKNFVRNSQFNKNDLLIAFSGSGNSINVINCIEYAKRFNIFTSCISGRGGGKIKEIADLSIVIEGSSKFPGQTGKNDNNFHIEDFQVSISHIITGLLKNYINKI